MNANELNWYYLLYLFRFAGRRFRYDKPVDVSQAAFHIFFDGNTDGDKDEDGD